MVPKLYFAMNINNFDQYNKTDSHRNRVAGNDIF